MRGAIIIDTDMCKGCGLCIVACPAKILGLAPKKVNRRGYPYMNVLDEGKCTGCASCAIVCPDSCITVYRKKERIGNG